MVMIDGAFVYPGSLGYTLYYATNFIFSGLAVAVAFHAKLFNIGGEGQAMIGGLGAALVCLALDPYLPGIIIIPLAITAAAALRRGVGVPAGLPAGDARRRTSSSPPSCSTSSPAGVLVTLLTGPLIREGQSTPQTRDIAESASLPRIHEIAEALGFEMAASPLNISIILALIACVGVWVLIWRTPFGYRLRTFGESEPAARYSGVGVASIIVITMCISGGAGGADVDQRRSGRAGEAADQLHRPASASPGSRWR